VIRIDIQWTAGHGISRETSGTVAQARATEGPAQPTWASDARRQDSVDAGLTCWRRYERIRSASSWSQRKRWRPRRLGLTSRALAAVLVAVK